MAKLTLVEPEITEDDKPQEGDKTEPRLPDDEGGDDDTEIDVIEEDETAIYYRPSNPDEIRRAWIASKMLSAEVDGKILVENMDLADKWIKRGALPPKERKLKTVRE